MATAKDPTGIVPPKEIDKPTRKLCSFSDCESESRARGFCSLHYQRYMLGLPMDKPRRSGDLRARFWERVKKTETCWLWTGMKNEKGYGEIRIKYRTVFAHRLSFALHFGETPEGLCVLHRCDQPSCVRPDHLFLGTRKQNRADCLSKNRHSKGENSGVSKLTSQQILEIRALRLKNVRIVEIAKKFGIGNSQVSRIAKRTTWTHLK